MYFEKLFPNKEIEWKCIYLIPRRVTIDTNLRIFQYKVLNNVLYLNKKNFKFKIVFSPLCSFCDLENKTPIHLFYSFTRNQTKSLWSKLQELMNSELLLPLVYQIINKMLKLLTICILYLSIICLKSRIQEK